MHPRDECKCWWVMDEKHTKKFHSPNFLNVICEFEINFFQTFNNALYCIGQQIGVLSKVNQFLSDKKPIETCQKCQTFNQFSGYHFTTDN